MSERLKHVDTYDVRLDDMYLVVQNDDRMVLIRPSFSTIDIFRYHFRRNSGTVSVKQDLPNLVDTVVSRTIEWLDNLAGKSKLR